MEQQPTRPYFSRTMRHRWRKPLTFSIVTLVLAAFFAILSSVLTPQQLAESEGLSALVFSTSLLVFLFITESIIKLAMLHPKIRRHTNILGLCIILLVFLVRYVSLHCHFPALPYETPFFSHFYPSIFGTSVSLGELVLNVSILLYFTLYVIRYINVQRFKNKGFNQAMAIVCFSIVTCLAFAVFFAICAFIGNMVLNTEFIIVPDKIAFFNADSYYIIFVIFSSYYCFALLIHKIIRLLSHAARHSFAKSAGFLSVNFLVVAIVSLCCWHTIYGIPTWVILILLGIYLVSGALTYRFARKNFRFFSILVKVIFAAFFISTILYIAVRQKESDQRQRIVAGFVAARAESESAPILDRNFINEASQLAQKYSFGYYSRGELIDQCGKYDYKLSAEEYLSRKFEDGTPIKSRGYIHHVYPISKDEMLIMGVPDRASFNYIASLAFFFITFLLFYLFCVTCIHVFARPPRYKQSLYSKLLWISLTAMLIVGIASCVLSLLLYHRHSDSDQKDILHAKTQNAQLSFLRHGGRWEDFYDEGAQDSLKKVLEEFEKTYELHIDVYDMAGNWLNGSGSNATRESASIETSVKEHFSESYAFLYKKSKTEEHIIHSLWQVITDSDGKVIVYLKTFFVKDQHAWKMELSDIVMSFMHVFGFIILLAVLAAWAIYLFVASSLSTIGKAMRKRRGKNSPLRIHWVPGAFIGMQPQV
ncbi:MAG: G-protein coupled receptor, partial [Bacteroidales bacterium]|nr:G-protein coupled receptor [Bacteroidales bacterium]